ncbi:S8 family serine peptidase [Nocardia abscessus]|uniref:S8 family serine peptidase n=1 Tax=Nocardia abscessus TaxID=120957 RepID=UPI001895A5C6|nr:S8 family serine peptidase [Nocardia abscessus]MBF6222794.1 S8 family serine peptidase [Nocardia abscessus]
MNGEPTFPSRFEVGAGDWLTLKPDLVLVHIPAANDGVLERLQSVLSSMGLARESITRATTETKGGPLNEPPDRVWLRTADARPITPEDVAALLQAADVDWVAPIYQAANAPAGGGLVAPLPDGLLIKPAPEVQREAVEAVLAEEGLQYSASMSKHLTGFLYFAFSDPGNRSNYETALTLRGRYPHVIADVRFEMMPMDLPLTAVPNDPLFAHQWNMTAIGAGGGSGTTGWDISTGRADVVICILDSGVDLEHPDLLTQIRERGINLGTMSGTGAPTPTRSPDDDPRRLQAHGTACAGIAAASFGNSIGVAGLAGSCLIISAAFQSYTDREVASGIGWAVDNGAQVINMSFGTYAPGEGQRPVMGWDFGMIDAAIARAVEAEVVMCAGVGNENWPGVNTYPARHPDVIAVGASDQTDNRWWEIDGESGSNFAPGVSVSAPGVDIPTTDLRGTAGSPDAGNDPHSDYNLKFTGTSAATAHVTGMAALIRSVAPRLSAVDTRNVIERSAAKVGTFVPYETVAGYPNGTRNDEMGYGRIDVPAALHLAASTGAALIGMLSLLILD